MFSKGVLHAAKHGGVIDDDDDDLAAIAQWVELEGIQSRKPKYRYRRIDWSRHLQMLRATDGFQTRYHMQEESFDALVNLLREYITVDVSKSHASTGGNDPISPEIICAAGIRFLGGEFHKSIADIYGISIKSAERIVELFFDAVLATPELEIRLPLTDDEIREGIDEWADHSTAGELLYGFIGAIDGWLCCTNMPSGVDNETDYFSGHYHRYGLNVQAVCDANLRFKYFTVVAPGKCNDARAFRRCTKLNNWLDSLPANVFVGGDNAYTLTDTMMVPFSGSQKHQPHKRTYNFHLSQLRIRIEMAFGLLSTKWRIFRRNLEYSLEKNIKIINVAGRLHNFVIDSDKLNYKAVPSGDRESLGIVEHPLGEEGNWGYLPNLPSRRTRDDDLGLRRSNILDAIIARDIQRPDHNLDRNEEYDDIPVNSHEDEDAVTVYAEDAAGYDDDVGFLPMD
jgi:hypothetical protein